MKISKITFESEDYHQLLSEILLNMHKEGMRLICIQVDVYNRVILKIAKYRASGKGSRYSAFHRIPSLTIIGYRIIIII